MTENTDVQNADGVHETDPIDQTDDEVRETQPTEPVDNSDDDSKTGKVHREAAKYRTQLRETETQLETITGQRNQLAAQVIENSLGNLKPSVFWKLGGEVSDYLNDEGAVDMDKVTKTAKTIGDDLGINTGPVIAGQEKRPQHINQGNDLHKAFEPR